MNRSRARRCLRVGVLATAVVALLLAVSPALAHVTVRADNPAAGGFAKYTVRVPNERDEAATVKVRVQMPEQLEASLYQRVPGWTIELADGVLTVEGGRIEPGQFQEFSFSARNPEEPGELRFPAVQTYEDGEEVRWVGESGSEQPASVVEIVAGEAGVGPDDREGSADQDDASRRDGANGEGTATAGDDAAVTAAAVDDAAGDPLVYAALALGAVGALAGGGALWRQTRRRG